MAAAKRQATAAQDQLIAANIAQELVDAARNQSWATLNANLGTTNLTGQFINRTQGTLNGGLTYMPRPVILDIANNTYTPQTYNAVVGSGNLFHGSVNQTITAMNGSTLNLKVVVTWPAENGGGNHTLVQSTLISQAGIHNY